MKRVWRQRRRSLAKSEKHIGRVSVEEARERAQELFGTVHPEQPSR